ncbi:dTDP-4-dehydrorhamnose reductase [Rhodopseudomonas rhenobacensis]|uniref:dTDP-4-dehydrorhamnose reductase n=1 Tax=Rhodopseudomonas rhenobacensis TaxID=87461 RepID=A0A7W7Z2W4_9BRAD|nr:dTDP-4-dehydrorhamnose reductase [Rhodopseudomonas rhenobacensis]MBB5047018.1 dTDP-4-dehydrorhamnose reductase [Rhodopseudomonas rhenobacensis]
MRLYVIGAEGQVARSLREAATDAPGVVFGYGARPEVDLLQPDTLARAIDDFRPDIVINPAAYTAVDKAEAEPEQAFALNRDGARAAARIAAERGLPIIHLSTDYVFDGAKQGPYVESDAVAPQGVYGRSKLEGELAVAVANPRHIVLRTAWVYAPFGGNFVRTMLRLAAERDRLRVVDDQRGCPTYAPDIADAIIAVARRWADSGWSSQLAGVTHLAGPDALTWCGFAREIIAGSAARGGRSVPVDPISTADYPTPAARPANSQLSTVRLNSTFGVHLPPMTQSLANCLDRLLGNR